MHLHALLSPSAQTRSGTARTLLPDSPSTSEGARGGENPRPCEETMNPYIAREKSSVAESVSRLVAEGGNVLASDDGPTAAGHAPVETTMPRIRGDPHRRFDWAQAHGRRRAESRCDPASSVARPCICLRPLHSRRKASQARKQSAQSESPSASSNDPRTSAPGKRQQLRRTSSDATT